MYTVFWFRRDLRIDDNAGLYHALKHSENVLPIFIFDKNIIDELPEDDKRISFIYNRIFWLKKQLCKHHSDLLVLYDTPEDAFKQLAKKYRIDRIYTNHDYEPYAKKRDEQIGDWASKNDIRFKSFKDQVIFEKDEIVKNDGGFYSVYTPYMRKWRDKLNDFYLKPYPVEKYTPNFQKDHQFDLISLEDMGFKENRDIPDIHPDPDKSIIKTYDKTRDFPAQEGTTRIGIHLRFGTISIRKLAQLALDTNETYLGELIWREFYMQVLYHNPQVVENSFKSKYDNIPWKKSKKDFERWCEGKTGIPIVDAGMRQLNESGYMHNRVRMIVASFLVKNLLIDWRKGEAYFAEKLLDYELASNNGGWQWAAGSGTDAAPYFRIFNPESQQDKYDKDYKYIKEWVEEFETEDYPEPMVDLKETRKEAIEVYKKAIN